MTSVRAVYALRILLVAAAACMSCRARDLTRPPGPSKVPSRYRTRSATMLLTISTTHRPATDLGFLLMKHPDNVHSIKLPVDPRL
jgi:hypothetical protein